MYSSQGDTRRQTQPFGPTVEITGALRHVSEKAILLDMGYKDPIWIPKSQIDPESLEEDLDEIERGMTITFRITEWIAQIKGLI